MSRTAEFILGLIGGIFGLISAMIVVFVETAFPSLGDQSAGWYAVLFSIIIIISAIIVKGKPKLAGIGLLVGAVGGLINIGLFYIIPGALAFIAGIMALVRKG